MLHLELDDEEAHFLDGMLQEDAAHEPQQPRQHGAGHEAQPPGPSAGYAASSLSLMHRLSIHPPPHQHQLRHAPMQHLPPHPEQPPAQHAAANPHPQPTPQPSTPSMPPQPAAEQLCRDYNDAAMHSLHAGQLPQAFEMLQLSLDLCRSATGAGACGTGRKSSSPRPPAWPQGKWLAITYNNLACYYKRQSKSEAALHYLQLAAGLEGCGSGAEAGSLEQPGEAAGPGGGDGDARASTLLNLCSVLCSLGRHEAALGHVEQALQLLSQAVAAGGRGQGEGGAAELLDPRALEAAAAAAAARPSSRPPASSSRAAQSCGAPAQLPEAQVWALLLAAPTSRVSLLAMALYNRGVVLEHLGSLGPAGRAYQAANNLACRAMGQGSGLAKTFGKSLQMFKMKVQAERRSAVKGAASSSRTSGMQQQLSAAARGASTRTAGAAGSLRFASARKASSSGSLASASASASSLFPSPSCPGSVSSSAPSCSGSGASRSARLGRVPLLEGRDRTGPRPGLAGSTAGAGARASPYLSSPPPPPPRPPPGKGSGPSPNIPGPTPRHVSSPAAAAHCQYGTGVVPPAAAPREPPAPAAQPLSSALDLSPSPGAQLVEKWLQRHSALALDQTTRESTAADTQISRPLQV